MNPNTESPLAGLAICQNKDGGWGYYPGKASWLEPTAWALIALQGNGHDDRCSRALAWMKPLQRDDGGIAPHPGVKSSSWVTSLWVTVHSIAGQWDANSGRALDWLLDTRGAEGAGWRRLLEKVRHSSGYDPAFYGWSWFPGTHSWLEPTVHSLVALKLAARHAPSQAGYIRERVALAEGMLLDRRCTDGAWNYGARAALGVPLPSYPECTGQALLALQGRPELTTGTVGALVSRWNSALSPMGRAWLHLGARLHRVSLPAPPGPLPAGTPAAPRDLSVLALQLIGASSENCRLLETGDWNA